MGKTSETRKPHGKFDAALLALDLALVAGVALLLWGFDSGLRKQAEIAALTDNRFLTTEWRLMRELKARTDQELRDKDSEIDALRLQYLRLKGAGSSAELLADIEAAMARAESERAAILASRANPEAPPPPAAALPSAPTGPSQGNGGASGPATAPAGGGAATGAYAGALPGAASDNALAELLRRRIVGLEDALRRSQAGSAAIERELAALRLDAARQASAGPQAAAASATTSAAPAASSGPAIPSAQAAPWSEADAVAAILSALESERAGLADPEAVLSLSDLKTRSIMRAIVRSPAIRSQYPDLFESLDRYLELVEKVGYLKGKQEALDEVRRMIEGVTSGEGK
jgi:hypothetical protein